MNRMSEESKRAVEISHRLWVRKNDLMEEMEKVDFEFISFWAGLGHPDKKIADLLGVSVNEIYRVAKKLGPDLEIIKNVDYEKERRLQDYGNGLTDYELSKKWGIIELSVAQWRIKRRLKPNKKVEAEPVKIEPVEIMKTIDPKRYADYLRGNIDSRLARMWGIRRGAVEFWRKKYGLERNDPMFHSEINRQRLADYDLGYSDKDLAKRWGITKVSVTVWRQRRKLPENNGSKNRKETNAERLADHDRGLTDEALGKKWEIDEKSVREWRRRRKLPENPTRKEIMKGKIHFTSMGGKNAI